MIQFNPFFLFILLFCLASVSILMAKDTGPVSFPDEMRIRDAVETLYIRGLEIRDFSLIGVYPEWQMRK